MYAKKHFQLCLAPNRDNSPRDLSITTLLSHQLSIKCTIGWNLSRSILIGQIVFSREMSSVIGVCQFGCFMNTYKMQVHQNKNADLVKISLCCALEALRYMEKHLIGRGVNIQCLPYSLKNWRWILESIWLAGECLDNVHHTHQKMTF